MNVFFAGVPDPFDARPTLKFGGEGYAHQAPKSTEGTFFSQGTDPIVGLKGVRIGPMARARAGEAHTHAYAGHNLVQPVP